MYQIKVLSSRRIYDGAVFSIRADKVDLGNGVVASRDVVEHSPAVCILPVDGQGRVYLVRQYRHAVGQMILEAPAGLMEPGETPEQAAERELREETGAKGKLTFLGQYLSSPGFCEEVVNLFLARVESFGDTDFDADEFLTTETYDFDTYYDMAATGKIRDGKTVAIALQAARILKNEGDFRHVETR